MTIQTIADSITKLLDKVRSPLIPISGVLLATATICRPGLSAITIAGNIIRRQSEAGAIPGANTDGSRNVAEAMEVIRIEEILKAIQIDGKVEIAIAPGSMQIVSQGGNAGGPVVTQGTNITPVVGSGIIR